MSRRILVSCNARPALIGDIVDLAAERIDFEHRLALRARHDAHRRIERAAGCVLSSVLRFCHRHAATHSISCIALRILWLARGAASPDPAQRIDYDASEPVKRELRLAEMNALA